MVGFCRFGRYTTTDTRKNKDKMNIEKGRNKAYPKKLQRRDFCVKKEEIISCLNMKSGAKKKPAFELKYLSGMIWQHFVLILNLIIIIKKLRWWVVGER